MFNPKVLISLRLAVISWLFLGMSLKAIANPSTVQDGIYLFGQSAKPYQIGQDYLIFRAKSSQVVGGVYRPNSEFYCFTGQIEGEQLKLSFVDPSNGTIYRDEIGIRSFRQPIASGKLPLSKLSLNGFEPLEKISEVDYEILNACLTNVH
jgi:hypothetical protein